VDVDWVWDWELLSLGFGEKYYWIKCQQDSENAKKDLRVLFGGGITNKTTRKWG
jgi:hypothetical protein